MSEYIVIGDDPDAAARAAAWAAGAHDRALAACYAKRAEAYAAEADPLYFQEQRGEVPAGTWVAKVDEIKARFPKPVQ